MKNSKRSFAWMTALGTVVLALVLAQALLAADRQASQPPDDVSPDTRTADEIIRDYMEGHYIGPEVADLSESTKSVNKAEAKAGSTLAYTIVVRNTSPNVPMCGNPDGPYPVSNST